MAIDRIPLTEFAARRRKALRSLKGAVGLLLTPGQSSHLPTRYRPDPNFEYFTGITDEPGAALLLDPTNPVEARRAALFLNPLNPELEKWDGFREEIASPLRDTTGFKTIFRTDRLPLMLREAAKRSGRLACLHGFATHTQPVSPDLAIFQKVAQRVPGVTIENHTETPAKMRSVKSANEVALLQRAVDITATAYEDVIANLKPGMNEFDVQEILEHAYRTRGSRGPAYGTIAGGGFNATVLHYAANDQPLNNGDLICIDSAAGFEGYSADITRTYPVNGRFTKRQREVYDIVLKAELASIKAVKPGVTFAQIDTAARDIITKAGFGDHFFHGIGHNLGLETHDITPEGPLKVGNVITIEPGIYLADENFGVRIEDDILVTKTGSRNLSAKIPKKAAEIEKLMKG